MKLVVAALAGVTLVAGISMHASPAATTGPTIFAGAQSLAGAKTYAAQCSRCHGANLEGVSAPALRGPGSGLAGNTVGEAFTFISTQMPAGNPGSLAITDYVNVMAFILSRNGHQAGPNALTPASAKKGKLKVS